MNIAITIAGHRMRQDIPKQFITTKDDLKMFTAYLKADKDNWLK